MSQSAKDFGKYGEDFLADGIIHLTMENVDGVTIQRRIRCVKMRGTHHSPDYYTLLYSDGEFQVTRVISEKSGF
jgi:KaiC/GvpD/RAD55 family RecA-like ATPase